MTRSGERRKKPKKKNKTEESNGRHHKSKRDGRKKRRRSSSSSSRDGGSSSEEHQSPARRDSSGSSQTHNPKGNRHGRRQADRDQPAIGSRRRVSLHTERSTSPSSSSTGSRSQSPAQRRGPTPSRRRKISKSASRDRSDSSPDAASNGRGRGSGRSRGDQPSRERPRRHPQRSPPSSPDSRQRPSRNRSLGRGDTVHAASRHPNGGRRRVDSSSSSRSRRQASQGSRSRSSDGRSRSPARRRWSPSPSPTTSRQRSDSRPRATTAKVVPIAPWKSRTGASSGSSPRKQTTRHKRKSPSLSASPSRSPSVRRRASRDKPVRREDTAVRTPTEEGRREVDSSSWSRREVRVGSPSRLKGRSRSPVRRRLSPSPSPTAPKRQPFSRPRSPVDSTDPRSRKDTSSGSPPRKQAMKKSRSSAASPSRSPSVRRRASRDRSVRRENAVARRPTDGGRREVDSSSWLHREARLGSPSLSKGRPRSPVHRRWSPSPSPTAPRRRSYSRPRSPVDSDRKSRKDTSPASPARKQPSKNRRKSPTSSSASPSPSPSPSPPPSRLVRQRSDSRQAPEQEASMALPPGSRSNGKAKGGGGGKGGKVDTERDRGSRPPKGPRRRTESPPRSQPAPPPPPPPKSSGKKTSSAKRMKRAGGTTLLSFGDDIGEEGGSSQAAFQGLGAATLNEFKRHKTAQPPTALIPAVTDSPEETPTVTTRLDMLLEKKGRGLLGPPKISTAECRGQREYQEDRHVVVKCLHSPDDAHTKFEACPPCFFAVYDGHNGNLASEIAKSKLHTYVAKAAPTIGLLGEPRELLEGLLRAAFASTEAEILKKADAEGGRQDGTTATACLLVGDLLVTANVGDSCAVLGSAGHEGTLRCRNLSSDHKPEDAPEKQRIEAAGGEVVFNGCFRVQHQDVSCRLAVSRSLGDSQFKGKGGQPRGSEAPSDMEGQLVSPEPSVKSVRLSPRDRVVIVASDGLWDVMTGVEAVELALAAHGRAPSSTGRAPSWADALTNGVAGENAEADPANALMKEAVKRGTADNVTAIVVVLPWD